MNIGFKSFHPVTILIFYIFVFAASLTATHPIVLFSVFVCGEIYDIKLRGKKALSFLLKLVLPLGLLSAAINGLFSHFGVTVLFTLPDGNVFTLESVIYGIVFALRASSMLIWIISFNETLTGDKIIFLFGRFSPKIALVISMALRFVPLIMRQSEEINTAEKGIGSGISSGSFIRRIKSASKRLSVLISWSLERGIDTQHSMNARGYGLKGRTSYNAYTFSAKDASAVLLTVTGGVLLMISADTLKALYNPEIIIPFPTITDTLICVFLTILLLLPLIIDIREERKWSISA